MAQRKGRDNFSQAVLQNLYKRVGGRCCRCGAITFGPLTNNPEKYRNIGQGAHIAAAAAGGPRYDPNMSPEKRSSSANGLWLCSNCHDIVDKDVEEFTVKVLKDMKRRAEERARREVGVAAPDLSSGGATNGVLDAGVSASMIVEIRKAKVKLLQLNGQVLSREEADSLLEAVEFINFGVDSYQPQVGRELTSYLLQVAAHCSDPFVVLEVIRRLKEIAERCHKAWGQEDVELVSHAAQSLVERFPRKRGRTSLVSQSALALVKDLCSYKDLQQKKLTSLPRQVLREQRGTDQTDAAPLPKQARMESQEGVDLTDADTQFQYFDLLLQLAEATDDDAVLQLESQLDDLGYEANVL